MWRSAPEIDFRANHDQEHLFVGGLPDREINNPNLDCMFTSSFGVGVHAEFPAFISLRDRGSYSEPRGISNLKAYEV